MPEPPPYGAERATTALRMAASLRTPPTVLAMLKVSAVLNGGDRVSILDLDLSALTVDVTGLNITLGNASAGLTAAAAGALSAAFGAPIPEGFVLGSATVNAVAK